MTPYYRTLNNIYLIDTPIRTRDFEVVQLHSRRVCEERVRVPLAAPLVPTQEPALHRERLLHLLLDTLMLNLGIANIRSMHALSTNSAALTTPPCQLVRDADIGQSFQPLGLVRV